MHMGAVLTILQCGAVLIATGFVVLGAYLGLTERTAAAVCLYKWSAVLFILALLPSLL